MRIVPNSIGMLAVMSRSLEIYQSGHSGRAPKKVTVHKNTAFTDEEILGALDAFNDRTDVELVQVVKSSNWMALAYGVNQKSDFYPVTRGTHIPVTTDTAFLWTQGSVKGVHMEGADKPVYKEGSLKQVVCPMCTPALDLILITLQRHAIRRPGCRVQHYGPIDEKQHHAVLHSRLALVVSARASPTPRSRRYRIARDAR